MYSVDELIDQYDRGSDAEGEDIIEGTNIEDEPAEDQDDTEQTTQADADKDDEQGTSTKVVKKIRKPSNRPKLDAERLKGPRGLTCMESLFSKIDFKGHGHEKEDLDKVMNTMQYWCHRLFPKFSFDDTLEHLERIGTKKAVITLKKKILFNLIEDEPIRQVEDEVIDEQVEQEGINEFDLLVQDTRPPPPAEVVQLTEEQKEMIARNRELAAERRRARLEALRKKEDEMNPTLEQSENISQDCIQSSLDNIDKNESTLTEEQKSIIERNRLLAIEKRRNKQNNDSITTESLQDSEDSNAISSQQPESEECDIEMLIQEPEASETKLATLDSSQPSDTNPVTEISEECDIEMLLEEQEASETKLTTLDSSQPSDTNPVNEISEVCDIEMLLEEQEASETKLATLDSSQRSDTKPATHISDET